MRRQMMISIGIVLLAITTVGVYALTSNDPKPEGEAGEHVHGAAAPAGEAGPVRLDAERASRIGVTYATAETGPMASVVRTVGAVTFDETNIVTVNPKIEGWVEKLYVDFNGAPVRKGQPLMELYSPMLVSAQEELILARVLYDGAAAESTARTNARELLEASRRRLAYWDVPAADIARIETTGNRQRTVVLRAPASGMVIEKSVLQGQRVMPGMDLYKIADLSTVWVEGEVFEKDLGLITLGSRAQITFESYPGKIFSGVVTYVYPTMTAESRTGRVRIALANPDLQLKPGMYATMEFAVRVHAAGIHIPRSAVLQTGERTVVFVRMADGALVPRQITAGMVTTEHVEVLAGLREGEVVVASANFLVDAESNLAAAMRAGQDSAPAPGSPPAHTGH